MKMFDHEEDDCEQVSRRQTKRKRSKETGVERVPGKECQQVETEQNSLQIVAKENIGPEPVLEEDSWSTACMTSATC